MDCENHKVCQEIDMQFKTLPGSIPEICGPLNWASELKFTCVTD